MFAASKTASSGGPPDAQFNYVTMLLHGDGTNGAQNNTFVDSSTNNFSITRNGNTTQGSFSPYGSNWGNYFDGTGDYLSVAYNSAFAFTGDFTVEFWVNFSAHGSYGGLICCGSSSITWSGWNIIFNSSTDNLLVELNNSAISIVSSSALVKNVWNHVALVRSGTSIVLYINGVSNATATYGNTLDSVSAPLVIGVERTIAAYTTGYISNVRVVKGTAVYTGAFTPPTAPLTAITNTSLLTCQSNRFIDNSANNFTITKNGDVSVQRFNPFGASTAYSTSVIGGSAYFDGSGDYLGCGSQTAYSFGTGAFTAEAWVYMTSRAASYNIMATRGSAGTSAGWSFEITTSGTITVYSDFAIFSGVGSVPLNAWTHVAFVREGTGTNQTKMYVNGVSVATATNTQNFTNTTYAVGASNDGSQFPFLGYITDARLVKGTAVYTANFTPNTAPLTAITNTSLLTNFTNGAIFDNAMMNDFETVGNAQISTSVKKFGTGSLAFDGSGDYLSNIGKPPLVFNSADFTVEMWMNRSSTQNSVSTLFAQTSGTTYFVVHNNEPSYANRITVYVDAFGAGTRVLAGGTTLAADTWYHIAITRASGVWRLFVNGVSDSTTYTNTANPTPSGANTFIGARATSTTLEFTGYIDDFRITNGYARYTANFTAPTAPFSNTGPI